MNEKTEFSVTCRNYNCHLSGGHILGTVDTEDPVWNSIRNPKNFQYCSACGKEALFECPECGDWHEVRRLSTRPYFCPTAVSDAFKKRDGLLFPPERLGFMMVLTLFIAMSIFVPWWASIFSPETRYYPLLFAIGMCPLLATEVFIFHFINKRKIVRFPEMFPKEAALLELYQKSLKN